MAKAQNLYEELLKLSLKNNFEIDPFFKILCENFSFENCFFMSQNQNQLKSFWTFEPKYVDLVWPLSPFIKKVNPKLVHFNNDLNAIPDYLTLETEYQKIIKSILYFRVANQEKENFIFFTSSVSNFFDQENAKSIQEIKPLLENTFKNLKKTMRLEELEDLLKETLYQVDSLSGLNAEISHEAKELQEKLTMNKQIIRKAEEIEARQKHVNDKKFQNLLEKVTQDQNTDTIFKQMKIDKQKRAIHVKNHLLKMALTDLKKEKRQAINSVKRLNNLEKLRSRFFENITHELRTPLTLIIGPLQKLLGKKESPNSESDNKTLLIAHKNSQKLLRFVNQLLELSKLEAGQVKIEARLLDLVECFKEFASFFSSAFDENQLEFQFSSEEKTIDCYFDPQKLEQIFFNLLSNSIKLTKPGGKIDLHISAPTEIDFPSQVPVCDLLIFGDSREWEDYSSDLENFENHKICIGSHKAKSILLSHRVKTFFVDDQHIKAPEALEILKYCRENQNNTYIAFSPYLMEIDDFLNLGLVDRVVSFSYEKLKILGTFRAINQTKEWDKQLSQKFVTITLEDTGTGMEEQAIDKIFRRFRSIENFDLNFIGSGLGLNIVKEYLDMHQCNVQVFSTPGRGTKFQITIPLGRDHLSSDQISPVGFGKYDPYISQEISDRREEGNLLDAEKLTFEDQWGTPRRLSDRRKIQGVDLEKAHLNLNNPFKGLDPTEQMGRGKEKILVIDDSKDMLHFLTLLLNPHHKVYTSDSGKIGFEKAARVQPSLILCDLIMPEMSGADLIKKLKNSTLTKHIPVIIITAKIAEFYELKSLPEIDGFLSKPFHPKELIIRVDNVLKFKHQQLELEKLNKDLTEKVLKRYLPPDLIEAISHGEIKLDDSPRSLPITVLFTDLKEFSSKTMSLSPRRMAFLINKLFDLMIEEIFKHGGTIDKFIGDSVMALFGAPHKQSPKFQVEQAIKCAKAMHERLATMNEGFIERSYPTFKMRIGIHHGPAVVGNFGNQRRQDYTAFGKTINLASRLEQNCPPGETMVSKKVIDIYEGSSKDHGKVEIKGFQKKFHCFLIK